MDKIKFLNYTDGERFSEIYQMLSEFFEKYTGDGLQENWHNYKLGFEKSSHYYQVAKYV